MFYIYLLAFHIEIRLLSTVVFIEPMLSEAA